MAETPGSMDADANNTNSKSAASKDKQCPFCSQPFTSSSLGRHLDLYIKEKNPKPSDGVHDVVEIRKMRGGITRRQPRSSLNKREDSTPAGTPGTTSASARRSPDSENGAQGHVVRDQRDIVKNVSTPTTTTTTTTVTRSPVLGRYIPDSVPKGGVSGFFEKPNWHATGVINDIPTTPVPGAEGREDEILDYGPRRGDRNGGPKTLPKHTLAKSTFDQKQKLMEAQDEARAAELALRELMGSVKAATMRVEHSPTPFDYDPLSLDFPALTLQCLDPPPTLHSVSPFASSESWSLTPPDQQQCDALRVHFMNAFSTWRISQVLKSDRQADDYDYPPREAIQSDYDQDACTRTLHQKVAELESKIRGHLHSTFSHWQSLPQLQRQELWKLELARSVGAKAQALRALKISCEKLVQENEHLREQVEYLSRCQQPREFQMMPPATISITTKVLMEMGERAMHKDATGVTIRDKDDDLQTVVKKSIGRWKAVVQRTRRSSSGGMANQRDLGYAVETAFGTPAKEKNGVRGQNDRLGRAPGYGPSPLHSGMGTTPNMDVDMDADAGEEDADGEVEEDPDRAMDREGNYDHHHRAQPHGYRGPPQANMRIGVQEPTVRYRLSGGVEAGGERSVPGRYSPVGL